jgi:monoamine oxidase
MIFLKMTRQEFLKKGVALGLSIPFLSSFVEPQEQTSKKPGSVLIIGAGAAGLAAGYTLKKRGADFKILEASSNFGGRVKRTEQFADFPIDLGAEWIHTEPSILSEILADSSKKPEQDTMEYNPKTLQFLKRGKLRSRNFISKLYSEWKFKRTTWFGFLEQYLLPEIAAQVLYNRPVASIDYSSAKIKLQTADGEQFEADKLLITVPLKVLQERMITFKPALPAEKTAAIDNVFVGDGLKIFVAFKERFYPDLIGFGSVLHALRMEDKYIYDAAFNKGSDQHVLGLFAINDKAAEYTQLSSEAAIIDKYLAELDALFDGQASQHYIKHVIQNWSAEPYIRGAYSYDFYANRKQTIEALRQAVADKLFFAGEALSIKHQSTVHGACLSGIAAAKQLLKQA